MTLDEHFADPGSTSIIAMLIEFKKEFDELKDRVEILEKKLEITK